MYLYNFLLKEHKFYDRFLINIIILNIISSYKGWRQLKGLPSNGQRTWSNGWSSFKKKNIIKNLRLQWAEKYYGTLPKSDILMAFSAEQTNKL